MLEKLFLTCDRLLSQQQVACCRSHCGFPVRGKDVLVYSTVKQDVEVCRPNFYHWLSMHVQGSYLQRLFSCAKNKSILLIFFIL